jgi:predicted nucleic acid-binding Zn ribbon protein
MWQPLGNLISDSIKKSGIGKQISDALICEEFQKIVVHILGPAAEHCHAVYIKDRTLWVAVLSSAVSNELKLYEADILKGLADKLGPEKVTGFRFIA